MRFKIINKKWVCSGGTKYNSGLINKKWVRSGRAISAIQSGHSGTPDLKKNIYINKEAVGPRTQCYSHSHVLAFTNCTQGGSGITHRVF